LQNQQYTHLIAFVIKFELISTLGAAPHPSASRPPSPRKWRGEGDNLEGLRIPFSPPLACHMHISFLALLAIE
jgi:hypothetical protein